MSATPLTADHVRRLIGDIFVYHMPFNRELGLKLTRHESDAAQLEFERDEKLVGNALQRILHGGVIASVLDVAAGITCVTSALLRQPALSEQDLRHRLAHMGTLSTCGWIICCPVTVSGLSLPATYCAAATRFP